MPFDIRAKVSKSVYDFLLYTQTKVSTKAIILTHTPSVHTVTTRRLHNTHCVKLCKISCTNLNTPELVDLLRLASPGLALVNAVTERVES